VTSVDEAAWHVEAAEERGQPADAAFTHIGLFLAWLIRNDLHDPAAFRPDVVAAVGAPGAAVSPAAALRGASGGRLDPADLSPEGEAFTAWYYPRYLDDYAVAFADRPDYGVPDDVTSYARIAPTIDRRYEEWLADGRPGPDEDDAEATTADASGGFRVGADDLLAMSADDLDEAARQIAEALSAADATSAPSVGSLPHEALDLEALLPFHVAGIGLEHSSARAEAFGSTLLLRAIERVGGDAAESYVAVGLGGTSDDTIAVTLYAIPGIAQDALEAEFERPEYLADDQAWERREVAGKDVRWAAGPAFDTAFYAMGGLVVTVGASPDRVRAALEVLP
jgi:hypothetical protein